MGEPRKKPGVAFCATAVVIAALAYVLSFGPWCWALGKWGPNRKAIHVTEPIFRPLIWVERRPFGRPLDAYADWWFEWGHANPDLIPTPPPAVQR